MHVGNVMVDSFTATAVHVGNVMVDSFTVTTVHVGNVMVDLFTVTTVLAIWTIKHSCAHLVGVQNVRPSSVAL